MTLRDGKLIPAANVAVAYVRNFEGRTVRTLRMPISYASSINSRSSVVKPAWWYATPFKIGRSSISSRPAGAFRNR
jgi:hypothetical protein